MSATVTGIENAGNPDISYDPSTPASTPVPTTEPDTPALVPGCHDTRIIEIQSRLMELGYMDSDEPTDFYGWGTEYSLQLFQRKHDLQIDGIAGETTLTMLFSEDAMPYTVKLHDRGTDVGNIQERLKDLKYLKSSVTGYFGTDTETAVKSFQKRNGLAADGNVGEMTREILFSEDAKAAPKSSGSSSGNTSGPIAVGDPDQASADALIEMAKSLVGSKYIGGAKGPSAFDCSGFVYYCLNRVGYKIGYMTSRGWAKSGLPRVTNMADMKPGDIICFSPHHVAIYIGSGQMIDASSSNGKVVQRSCNTSYWKSHFICARRIF
jgi:cell wall-associated NlpC family hydrolase